MCAICGICNFKGERPKERTLISMRDIMRYRGPDDEGLYLDDKVGLGHRRLSIIDLTEKGHQPMFNEDGSLVTIFNGEIYNYKELKKYLMTKHHIFKSNSDTEVIPHGFEEWGDRLFERLDGMFAIALWDKKNETLYLARDAFGIKPLFYYHDNEKLIFASEIKSLLVSGLIKREINLQALSDYFSYFYVPGRDSIIKDIKCLPPAGFIKFSANNLSEKKYWNISLDASVAKMDYIDMQELTRESIKKSIKKSLVSDVPVGILLSGGLDSNIILREMSSLYPDRIKSFTVSFSEKSYDEADVASEAARMFNTDHHEINFDENLFLDFFDDSIYHLDNLNANPTILASYAFYKLASKKIKVALIGSGGDELFGGYPTYLADNIVTYYSYLPIQVKKVINKIARLLPVGYEKYSYSYVLNKFTEGSFYPREKAHYWWRTIFNDDEKNKLLEPIIGNIELDSSRHYQHIYEEYYSRNLEFSDASLISDFYLFLIDNALSIADNLSMAFSLEVRPPFLTKEFINFAFSIPFKFKVRSFKTKRILRDAYKNRLSKRIIKMKKHGLIIPLNHLFLQKLKDYVIDNLRAEDTSFISQNSVKEMLERHYNKSEDNSFKIYSLLVFKKWYEKIFKI